MVELQSQVNYGYNSSTKISNNSVRVDGSGNLQERVLDILLLFVNYVLQILHNSKI